MKRIVAVIALAALLIVGVISDAFASIPDGNGVFYGCVKADGTLTVKDDGGTGDITCGAQATKITWNQTGPVGPVGPTGPQGIQGEQGPAGYLSATGVTVTTHSYSVAPGSWFDFTLTCPGSDGTNRLAVNGGFDASAGGTTSSTIVPGSHPTASGDGWEWWVYRFGGTDYSYFTVWLTCLAMQ